MKKVLMVLTAACLLMVTGCKKKSPPVPLDESSPPKQTLAERVEEGPPQPLGEQPQLPPADQLGEKVTFELSYRSITGKEDDVTNLSGWGFGSNSGDENSFIDAVKKQTRNKLYIARNNYLKERRLTAIEYKDKDVLYAYFDLNADGQLSGDERLGPAEVCQRMRRGDNTTVFMTPDFMTQNKQGQPTPFSVLLWVRFYENNKRLSVTWSPLGLYEGTADIGGSAMKLCLLPNFSSKSYTEYARSRYSLIPIKRDKHSVQNTFSSIIVADSTFYRVVVDEISPLAKTIKVSLFEDKTPRGKMALNIQGKHEFEHLLSNASVRGAEDKTVYFRIGRGANELPAGNYKISYGSFQYGKENTEEYYTSFRDIPAFTVKEGQETTIDIGKPAVKLQAIEQDKRYNGNRKYKTEFAEGTTVYIDAVFKGKAGETYSSFSQRVQKDNYTRHEDMKARIRIVDAAGKEMINKELEYG